MSKFKVGDLVVIRKPENVNRYPFWVVSMDKFDGITAEVTKSGGRIFQTDKTDDLEFHHSWGTHVPDDDNTISHYTPDASGKDYLARCEETYSREEMIGAYRFTLGKYVDRMGKKQGEPVEKELEKIIEYATRAKRWLEGRS